MFEETQTYLQRLQLRRPLVLPGICSATLKKYLVSLVREICGFAVVLSSESDTLIVSSSSGASSTRAFLAIKS